MARPRTPKTTSVEAIPTIPASTELLSLTFELQAVHTCDLYSQYTIGLHAWFLEQIRQVDPKLSAYLHDGESEKPFTITGLDGKFTSHSRQLQLQAGQPCQWQLTALSKPVVRGIATWLKQLPKEIPLKNAPLQIQSIHCNQSPTTYTKLWQQAADMDGPVSLSFLSPTSFRRKGHHFPLPVPTNLFHSYLRRWNDFSGRPFDPDEFLYWVEEHVILQQLRLESSKVAAGKKGSVTGFMGAIALGLGNRAQDDPEFRQLFYALLLLAPYCGTGHKTTFGLGQTQLGWSVASPQEVPTPSLQTVLADRIAELTQIFLAKRKRIGGDRATQISETWATVLARRELGESLTAIAEDLEIPYETAKTYVKLARRSLKEEG